MKRLKIKTILLGVFAGLFILSACKKNELNDSENNNGNVGESSNSLLSDNKYTSLTIEIIYMPGFSPNQNSINNLTSFLQQYLNKPDGIEVVLKEIPSSGKESYSSSDINDLEDQYRSQFNSGSKITVSMLVLDGSFSSNANVLGIAYKNTSLALFGEIIHEHSGGLTQPTRTKLESTVMHHEFGHILGLVNIGTPMVDNHEDNSNSKHCDNSSCLMYYTAETTEIASFLVGNDIPQLDENCKDDLTANGGK